MESVLRGEASGWLIPFRNTHFKNSACLLVFLHFLPVFCPKPGSTLFKSIYLYCIPSRLIQLLQNTWWWTLFLQVLCLKCCTILVHCTRIFFLCEICFAWCVIQLSPLSPREMVAEVAWRQKIMYSGFRSNSGFIHPYVYKNLEKQLHNHRTTNGLLWHTDIYKERNTPQRTANKYKLLKIWNVCWTRTSKSRTSLKRLFPV